MLQLMVIQLYDLCTFMHFCCMYILNIFELFTVQEK